MSLKDFAPIVDDYAFFMQHASEAAGDLAEYGRAFAGFARGRDRIRLLDFGCGSGEFSAQFLQQAGWPPEALELTLVEPVRASLELAAERVARFSGRPVTTCTQPPTGAEWRFDAILSNHALYYVDDLAATLGQLVGWLAPGGTLSAAIAGWDNALLEFWRQGFALLGREVPYHTAEEVESILAWLGANPQKTKSSYQVRFPDSTENRWKILRFLLGEHLAAIGPRRLLGLFDRYVRQGEVVIETHSYHFTVGCDPRGAATAGSSTPEE